MPVTIMPSTYVIFAASAIVVFSCPTIYFPVAFKAVVEIAESTVPKPD
jgi:hypothetical protein